jgi:hypothetical protein
MPQKGTAPTLRTQAVADLEAYSRQLLGTHVAPSIEYVCRSMFQGFDSRYVTSDIRGWGLHACCATIQSFGNAAGRKLLHTSE